MDLDLPADVKSWAEAQVAAGRADSIDALAVQALVAQKARMDFIAAQLEAAIAESDRDGWTPLENVLNEMDGWDAELDADGKLREPAR